MEIGFIESNSVEISFIEIGLVQKSLLETSLVGISLIQSAAPVTQNGHSYRSDHSDQTPESHQALPLPREKQINVTKVDRDNFKKYI